MHWKKIRKSHKGKNLHPQTRGWLLQCVKEENQLAKSLAAEIERAGAEGRCRALVLARPGGSTPYRHTPSQDGHLCGRPAFPEFRGYCAEHFRTHVLYLPSLQSDRAGRGVSQRPFRAAEFPSGRLSEKQIDLMNDLERLPMATPLEECIARLNAEDRRRRVGVAAPRKPAKK